MKKFLVIFALSTLVITLFQVTNNSRKIVGPKPASVPGDGNQQMVIDHLTEKILSMKSREDVLVATNEIKQISSREENLNFPVVQVFRAVAQILPSLEGIIYRCRMIVEPSDWLQISALSQLRAFSYDSFVYGDHVKAIFNFLTYPSHHAGKPFQSVAELQAFLLNTVTPQLDEFLALAKKSEKLPAANFEVLIDKTLAVGISEELRFIDKEEAKKIFIKPYFFALEGLLHRVQGSLYYFSAIELNDLPKVANALLKKTTINTFIGELRAPGDSVKGVTPILSGQAIKKFPKYLTWKKEIQYRGTNVTAQSLLDRSFNYFRAAAHYQRAGYICGLSYPLNSENNEHMTEAGLSACGSLSSLDVASYHVNNGREYLFDPNGLVLRFKQKNKTHQDRVRVFEGAANGQYVRVLSDATGKSVDVFAKAFFNTKQSQRDFLPISFKNVDASSRVEELNTYAWNYNYGKPAGYRDFTFNGFFNSNQVNSIDSLEKAMATLLYSDSISSFATFIRLPTSL
ncbi:MAG: hypothetical protein WC635_12605 [Bacteriovorax sp.]|jgi:hypothetical protein